MISLLHSLSSVRFRYPSPPLLGSLGARRVERKRRDTWGVGWRRTERQRNRESEGQGEGCGRGFSRFICPSPRHLPSSSRPEGNGPGPEDGTCRGNERRTDRTRWGVSERDTAPGVRLVTSSSRFGCRSFLPSLIHSLRLPRGSVRHLTPPSLRSPKAVKERGTQPEWPDGPSHGTRHTTREAGVTGLSFARRVSRPPAPSVHGWLGLLSLTLHLPFTGGAGPCGAKWTGEGRVEEREPEWQCDERRVIRAGSRSSLTPFPYASRSSHSSLVRSSRSPAARAYVKNEEMNRSRRRQASRGTEGRDERENVERIRILFPKEKRKRNANRRK